MTPTQPSTDAPGGAGNIRPKRRGQRGRAVERFFVRLVGTGGIIGIGVGIGAILASSKVQGWLIGLVVAVVSVALAGLLWSSRTLRAPRGSEPTVRR